MLNNNLSVVYKEAWKYVVSSFTLFVLFLIFDFSVLSFLSFLATMFFLFIFRNPERELPRFEKGCVVSPVDGVVKSITEIEDSEYAYRIDIEGTLFDVGVLRVPMNAMLEKVSKRNGARLSQKNKLFKDLNECSELLFTDDDNNKLMIEHKLKESFAPIYLDVVKSQKLHQTARYGMMNNGVTTMYIPSNFRLNVNIGNELKASESLLGYFS